MTRETAAANNERVSAPKATDCITAMASSSPRTPSGLSTAGNPARRPGLRATWTWASTIPPNPTPATVLHHRPGRRPSGNRRNTKIRLPKTIPSPPMMKSAVHAAISPGTELGRFSSALTA